MKITLIKLGGSVITDKSTPYKTRLQVIQQLAKEIHLARKKDPKLNLIIAHGSGSFGHTEAMKYKTQKGLITKKSIEGIAKVQNTAAKLNRIITEELINAKEHIISIAPSSIIGKKGFFTETIEEYLELNLTPLLYGDVILDKKQGIKILSTEELFMNLIKKWEKNKKFQIEQIIMVGDTNGVLSSYPSSKSGNHHHPNIKIITQKNFHKITPHISPSKNTDTTGGMLHKVENCLKFAKKGISTQIINGLTKNSLYTTLIKVQTNGTLIK